MSDDQFVFETGEAQTVTGKQTGTIQEIEYYDSQYGGSIGFRISHPSLDNGIIAFYNTPEDDQVLTTNFELGKLLSRFGATVDTPGEVNMKQYLDEGTRVDYEVVEEEVEDDPERDTTLNIVPDSVRPPGEEYDEEVGSSEPDKVISPGLEDMLSDIMPAARADIINELATEGTGEEVQEFQAALEQGLFKSKPDGRLALE